MNEAAVAGDKPALILLGRIAGAHGIGGEVLIHCYATLPESLTAYGPLSDADGGRTFTITRLKPTARGVLARLVGINDRTTAEDLKGVDLYVPRARLPEPAEGEFYHVDLIGLLAIDAEGRPFGEIAAVHNFGAGDLLEIRLTGSSQSELVPFSDATVPSLDVAAGRAVIIMPRVSGAAAAGQAS